MLDACRYDSFERLYDGYFSGDLQKRRSPGSATPEWAAKTFTADHDITYLSANPFVNSLGVPLDELRWGASCEYEWAAADHIDTVVDLWRDAWDDDLGAVTPGSVTEHARRWREETDDPLVVHYLQPHAPYLRRGTGRKLRRIRGGVAAPPEDDPPDGSAVGAVREWVERRLGRSQVAMMLGMLVELDPASVFDIGGRGFAETIRSYYEENLRLALAAASDLASDLDGRVVVTADHGEAFGEHGVWEHHVETHIPPLVDVPWLVLD
ncbi:hypothetical protein K933_00232 [Candidatus Halobonum tyrrellensis G22]|uniref:Sulfatase n=1 Tax=Candidatus Halobonum tyrrellensis G22 TaxID=1324957 RepID=V4HJK8_9EURY|nr:hypothetical protein K933_00232 [Candidatus Halobonum tyrrellensis G22]